MTTALEEMDAPPCPATEMDAVAPHAIVGGPSEAPGAAGGQQPAGNCFTRCCHCKITPCKIVVILVVCCIVAFAVWFCATYEDPNYSVMIANVSGLDRRPAMEPQFNLTFSIMFRSSFGLACDDLATTVQVSYHGFQLASAGAPQVCQAACDHAKKGRTSRVGVVARGTRVWLPVLDSLAADLRRGAGVFDVVLTLPDTRRGRSRDDDGLLVSCTGRPVGDAGGGALCDVRRVERSR